MGAKDWMLLYSDGDIPSILRSQPVLDRDATRDFVARLYAFDELTMIEDGALHSADPPEDQIYAGCFPGLSIMCTADAALDRPSRLDRRFVDEAGGRALYLHAMHSAVDWFAYAIWNGVGTLLRSLSLSPDDGIFENLGDPLPFEAPYWAGDKALPIEDGEEPYALPFHPLELGEDALRNLFGFNYEGYIEDNDLDLAAIVLVGFAIKTRD